jgi:hypothetical protein
MPNDAAPSTEFFNLERAQAAQSRRVATVYAVVAWIIQVAGATFQIYSFQTGLCASVVHVRVARVSALILRLGLRLPPMGSK